MNRWFLALGFLAGSNAASAAQSIIMDPTVVVPVELSSQNHNRISIAGDRIKKAIFRSSNISVDVEEDSGQIFVQATRPNCPNTTLSVVSASGIVQDMELRFVDGSSQIVFLQLAPDVPVIIDSACGDTGNMALRSIRRSCAYQSS